VLPIFTEPAAACCADLVLAPLMIRSSFIPASVKNPLSSATSNGQIVATFASAATETSGKSAERPGPEHAMTAAASAQIPITTFRNCPPAQH
jgi:hypothetical protein